MSSRIAAYGLAACFALAAPAIAQTTGRSAAKADRVLLISIAGMHDFDLTRFVAAHPDSALARLGKRGAVFSQAMAPVPSDSFPGMIALVTGALPKRTGVFYDDSWDRALSPAGSDCSKKGAAAPFNADIDVDGDKIDTTIDEAKLPRDPARGCKPVWPHQYLRVNTIFEIVKAAGGRTAWADKHPSYEILRGPSGKGIDDLYTPEISAAKADTTVEKAIPNDELRVTAVLNQIAGKNAAGGAAAVPALFGMNFEAFSVAQKNSAGYLDAAGTPNPEMTRALTAIDQSLARMLAALDSAGLSARTAIVVTAKHGQSPVDIGKKRIVDSKALKSAVGDALAYQTADDVALLWLTDRAKAPAVRSALEARRGELGIGRIHGGKALLAEFGDPARDNRVPDLIVESAPGVIYTKPTATKIAEHGGFAKEDRHVALLVALPGGRATTVTEKVETRAVAPTILRILGLDLKRLDATATGVRPLPQLGF
ncbi:MAG TPA: alkaline phosphatase family protein [Stellaceae bacterium]|nr:alkaline phosphatase family protein [Stellaceae bacterium]